MWRSTLHPVPFGLRPLLVAGILAGVVLAGCNEGTMPGPVTAAMTPVSTANLRLPPGAPCSGEISRFEAVVKGDLDTGNVEQKVYDQIEGDLRRAAVACSAGKGGEAHGIVAASKARHGYRA